MQKNKKIKKEVKPVKAKVKPVVEETSSEIEDSLNEALGFGKTPKSDIEELPDKYDSDYNVLA